MSEENTAHRYAAVIRPQLEKLLAEGQTPAALRLLEEALWSGLREDEEAVTDLAVLYHVSQRAPDAERLLSSFVADHPRSMLARKRLALIELIGGNAKTAIATIEPVLVQAPNDAEALRIVGDIASAMNSHERAREFYLQSLAADPRDAETQARLASLPARAAANQGPPARRFSDLLDLRTFFEQVPVPYAVLRLSPDFPHYSVNEDIDLVCATPEALRTHIRAIGRRYEERGFRIAESTHQGHLHIDFFAPGEQRLNFRFDILETLACFQKIRVDAAWTEALLERRRTVEQGGFHVSVPAKEDELSLRLLEYLEHRDARPDKVKHLHHVQKHGTPASLAPLLRFTDLKLSLGNPQLSCELKFEGGAPAQATASAATDRMDYFLIWGHGLAHAREILEIIRAHPAFEIVSIYRRDAGDMAKFVQRVYECDAVPMEHLIAKTRYLLTVPSEIMLAVVRNKDPREKYFGEGAFRHIQCEQVKAVKEIIRNRFNPRAGNKRSENHVIHASDYESQTRHVLSVLGLPDVEEHRRNPNPALLAPHHIPPFEGYRLQEVPLDSLRANILGRGMVTIAETPHYQYALGNKAPYAEYQARHAGQQLTDDHYPEAFDRLMARYDPARDERDGKKSYILAVRNSDGSYLVLDGVHRASLLAARGARTAIIAEPQYKAIASAPGPQAYRTPPTCQIPNLADIYQRYIGFKTNGVFVEVGAFDGEYVSNTSNLADLGWSGHYIEPVPEHVAACRKRHGKNPNTRVFELAIAEKEGEARLHVGGVLSTMDPESLRLYETFEWAKGIHTGREITVRQTTLDQFLRAQQIKPGFEVLVVDVEGFEWNVLQGFSIAQWKPKLAIIELHDENDNYLSIRESCQKAAGYFRANGYRAIYKDQTNTVFLREDADSIPEAARAGMPPDHTTSLQSN